MLHTRWQLRGGGGGGRSDARRAALLVAVTGIAVTVAPIAVPLAAPFLYKAVSNGGFDAVVKKLFAAPGKAAAVQKVVINVPGLTRSEAAPVVQSAIQENV